MREVGHPGRRFRLGLAIVWLAGCSVHTKAVPAKAVPARPPEAVDTGICAADVAIIEKTPKRMSFAVENKSTSSRSGAIRQVRLLFTAARCPLSVQSPAGWSGSIDARRGEHACEVAWISNDTNASETQARKEGFVALFRAGRIELPSWAVFLDKCAVSGPHRPIGG